MHTRPSLRYQKTQSGTHDSQRVEWQTDLLQTCVNDLQELLLTTTSTLDAAVVTRDQLIRDRNGLLIKIQELADLAHKTSAALHGEVSSRDRTSSLLDQSVATLTHAREDLLKALGVLHQSIHHDHDSQQ